MIQTQEQYPLGSKNKSVKVLLADDESMVQKMVERRLVANGYEVILAGEASESKFVVGKNLMLPKPPDSSRLISMIEELTNRS